MLLDKCCTRFQSWMLTWLNRSLFIVLERFFLIFNVHILNLFHNILNVKLRHFLLFLSLFNFRVWLSTKQFRRDDLWLLNFRSLKLLHKSCFETTWSAHLWELWFNLFFILFEIFFQFSSSMCLFGPIGSWSSFSMILFCTS